MKKLFPEHNFDAVRDKMYALRHNFFDNMDKYLLDFDKILSDRGVSVMWTKDADSLTSTIGSIAESKYLTRVCIDSDTYASGKLPNCDIIDVKSVENSSDDIDLLIVDSDFAVCDTGSLVFLNKESQNCFNKAKNLVVIVNIDQVISSYEDLSLFISLRRKDREKDLPEDIRIIQDKPTYVLPSTTVYSSDATITQQEVGLTVILNLNKIEDILLSEDLVSSLYCIHCGRCMEVCPVANNSDTDAVSPIDIVKLNTYDNYNRAQHIFKHTTLCGACDDVCPVKIPLTKLMLYEMQASNMVVSPSRPKQLYSLFQKRSNINKTNNPILKFIFIKRFFGRNKMLSKYYSENSSDYFNISFTPPHEDNPNEILKDSDFE